MYKKQLVKYASYISALIPAGASYLINIYAASIFTVANYAEYIFVLSVATFLGTLAGFGVVDLAVTNTSVSKAEHERNFGVSIIVTAFSSFLVYIFYPGDDGVYGKFAITLFVFLFSLTRCYHLFLANNSLSTKLLMSRSLRAGVLIFTPLFFFVAEKFEYSFGYPTLILMQCSGLLVGLLISNELYSSTVEVFRNQYRISLESLILMVKRTSSLALDLVHMPLCIYALKCLSEVDLIGRLEILLFGLTVPIITLVTQVFSERMRALYASSSVEDLIDYVKKFRSIWLVALVFLLFIITIVASKVLMINIAFLFLLMVFTIAKLSSSVSGLFVYKARLEMIDLGVNAVVSVLMLGFLIFGANSLFIFLVLFSLLILKYLITNFLVYRFASKK